MGYAHIYLRVLKRGFEGKTFAKVFPSNKKGENMFLTIKKRTIIVALCLILALVGTIVGVVVGVRARQTAGMNGQTVVIDAGHGGIDGGVVGHTTGIKESDINLAISQKLQRFLEGKGYRVVMTRNTKDGLYGLNSSNKKMADMHARRDIINRANPDLVVSIHQNSFPAPSVRGPQVFYSMGCEISGTKAELMQTALNTTLDSNRLAKQGDFFILENSPSAALLVESGFLSNPEDEALLVQAEYQEKIAYTIANSIHLMLMGE